MVEALAPDVNELAVGDRVFGIKGFSGGAQAEFLHVAAKGTVLRMPDSLSFDFSPVMELMAAATCALDDDDLPATA